jgi:hypothetical protein
MKAVAEYMTGDFTIRDLAENYCISTGKMYSLLLASGCVFSRKHRKKESEESRRRRSAAQKGKEISEEQRRKISERNACNYNGLNGYGHTKRHNRGYVLAYAPKHPNAHTDGYVMLHTILMERAIGRYLAKNEVVHHVNHIRDDNRIENLHLMDKHEHRSMHMKERHMKRRNDLSIV